MANRQLHPETEELLTFSRKALIFAVQILGNQSEAEDVVQASIEKALSHPSAPHGGVDLQKWLYRVVRNAAIDRIRQQARESEEASESQLVREGGNPESQLEQQQLQQQVRLALASLPAAMREILVLKDFHDCSYEDIAEILSIAKGTVMSRLHRARMALRQQLLDIQQNTSSHSSNVVVLDAQQRAPISRNK
ncbi:MAG: RNA polymerase sigma factor [Kangiellaceae bacterium]|nr:RNA polymerase sigma factor [Kangiellaceae bacterium]